MKMTIWQQAISHCISPPLPPPDLRRQENLRQFMINRPKHICHHRKNIVWN